MAKFRKKPVVIEAHQWNHGRDSHRDAPGWLIRAHTRDQDEPGAFFVPLGSQEGFIVTLEGRMTVSPDDWIIKGVKGELYPCKPDIFEATYEAV